MVGTTGPAALDEGRNWRRVALAVVPWVLAGVLGLLGVLGSRNAPAAPAATATTPPPAEAVAAATTTATPEPAAARTSVPRSSPGQLDPDQELAVLLAARNAMGTAGLTDHAGGGDRWPLDARVVSLDDVTAEYAVATVHGLVLEQDDEGWNGPHPMAVAVLLRRGASSAVVGDAWPLAPPATPDATPDAMPQLRTVDEPDPSIVAPLTDAGWSVEEIVGVEASDDALLRIVLEGTPPGASRPAEHVLWLLDAPGGPRLLPLTATPEDEDLP